MPRSTLPRTSARAPLTAPDRLKHLLTRRAPASTPIDPIKWSAAFGESAALFPIDPKWPDRAGE